MDKIHNFFKFLFTFRWKPNLDTGVVVISWVLVTSSLYTATKIVTPAVGGGIPYFLIYAILTALILGIGVPLLWMVIYRKRPVKDLGITRDKLGTSLILQLIFSLVLYFTAFKGLELPAYEVLVPLVALALTIGLFEAVFWRGWVLLRLEESFGILPAIILGSLLYALYHVGYGMPMDQIQFLFWIGVLFAVCFRITSSIFILWPLFQPMGQLVTLIKDGLSLPLMATIGFLEILLVMWILVWLANRYYQRQLIKKAKPVG